MQQFIDNLISRLEEKIFSAELHDCGWEGQTAHNLLTLGDVRDAAEQLAEEYKGGWIPCSKQKPKDGEKVITCDDRGNLHVFRFEVSLNCFLDDSYRCIRENHPHFYVPIAWMPLPEPYQKDGE